MSRWAIRGPVRVVAAVALSVVLVQAPGSPASAAPILDRTADTVTLFTITEQLRARLGGAFAGSWLDQATGQLTIGVTNPALAPVVRLLGANPQVVARSSVALDGTMARLDSRSATVPASVTGWYVDLPTNTVVVSVLGSDPAAQAFVAAGGEGVRVEQVSEAPVLYWSIIGGQAITTGGARCSAGFNARSGAGVRYVITAGHCTNIGSSWNGIGGVLGTRASSSFPGNDYGIIRVTSAAATSTALVDRYSSGSDVTVAGSTPAIVGAPVCRSGSTTGWRCGLVTAKNQTVNYGSGQVVSGLTRTTACAEPGDSGGAFVTTPVIILIPKVQAQGMTSGGSGNCTVGGTTFFQPVGEALTAGFLTLTVG